MLVNEYGAYFNILLKIKRLCIKITTRDEYESE